MNIALVHDWLNQLGGAEDVLDLYGTINNIHGPARPFWLIPRDDDVADSGADRQSRAHWVWLKDDVALSEKFTNLFDFDMAFEEVI